MRCSWNKVGLSAFVMLVGWKVSLDMKTTLTGNKLIFVEIFFYNNYLIMELEVSIHTYKKCQFWLKLSP